MTGAQDADFFMDYYNADGGPAKMCGNGIRCLAKLAYETGLTDKRDLAVSTRAGLKHVSLHVEEGQVDRVTVDMGAPGLKRGDLPMQGDPASEFLGEPVEVDGGSFKGSAVSMGNPHLVLFVDTDPRVVDVEGLGSRLESFSAEDPIVWIGGGALLLGMLAVRFVRPRAARDPGEARRADPKPEET